MRKLEEEESSYYSNNKLNLAFIAEDSKDIESISLSGSACDRDSISSISRVASNSIPGSPFLTYQPEISNMEQWSNDTPNIFGKQSPSFGDFRKRQTKNSIPESIEQNNQDDQQIEKISKCTKKRIGEKNKIITIQPIAFNQYGLRSKGKVANIQSVNHENESSSSEQLREMVNQMGSKKLAAKIARYNNV